MGGQRTEKREVDIRLTHGQGVQIGDHGQQTNIYQLFATAAPNLTAQIRTSEFRTLIAERTRTFLGRDFVFAAIEKLLNDASFPSGYIVIRGEPGIGKTALLAQLVGRLNCVHHFNIASQNIRSSRDFLTNVCAQLIVRYDLPYSAVPAEATSDGGFLSQLLSEASAKNPSERVVVLVDALDEADCAGLAPSVNCLYLPSVLPAGVFVIATSREDPNLRLLIDRERAIYLKEDDPHNQEDVRSYIANAISSDNGILKARIVEWGLSQDAFTELLATKSEGNFMYLVYVTSDIRNGYLTSNSIENIKNLPQGLTSYYRRHWRAMRAQDPARFEKYYEPIICQLAVARESVSANQLAEWTNLSPTRIVEVIQTWRQFLNEDLSNDESVFRLYHASFRDFLKEEVGLKRFHERIVETALKKLPGFHPRSKPD